MKKNIKMVDLKSQYLKIKNQIDSEILSCIDKSSFINGPSVKKFEVSLSEYLNVNHVIPCANGTDALQIALMSLNLKRGDEVICPSFTYVATAEVISLLGFKPIMADVDYNTFNITSEIIKPLISNKTKVIIPVHLFGQSCDMESIMNLANKNNIFVIEDNAQSFGSLLKFSNNKLKKTGTIGHIGTTSFFPSKILGCYGDGGAIFTNDESIANRIKMIANHGQEKKYYHKILGCNSRLDSIQASILNVKLKYIDRHIKSRILMSEIYDKSFKKIDDIILPKRFIKSTHVFHQYTLKIMNNKRDKLKSYLNANGIPSMIYYPIPLYKQEAFSNYVDKNFKIPNVENLCNTVLSLPIHSEIENANQDYIINKVIKFFNEKG
tara:strand:- start:370 stop:1509 length:1140 start_codon:yes stop_codon:yes gene_type:complete